MADVRPRASSAADEARTTEPVEGSESEAALELNGSARTFELEAEGGMAPVGRRLSSWFFSCCRMLTHLEER